MDAGRQFITHNKELPDLPNLTPAVGAATREQTFRNGLKHSMICFDYQKTLLINGVNFKKERFTFYKALVTLFSRRHS